MPTDLQPPWKEFLKELDALLDEPIEMHCIGGFAVVAGYGLPRATNDIDYRSMVPFYRIEDLQRIAGPGSTLARKHGIYLQYTGVDSIPEGYAERLSELYPGRLKNVRLFVPDPYDLVLSKLSRNVERDRQDVEFLAATQHLDAARLQERYDQELRAILIGPVERHDATLRFWIEAYFAKPH